MVYMEYFNIKDLNKLKAIFLKSGIFNKKVVIVIHFNILVFLFCCALFINSLYIINM